jgi:predicted permease
MLLDTVHGLRASRPLLVTSVVTLAAAIGMNVAMAGLVSRALLAPARHVSDPSSLAAVMFEREGPEGTITRTATTSWPAFLRLRESAMSIEGAAAFQPGPGGVTLNDEQIAASTVLVSREYFSVLGARAHLGAAFGDEPHAAVISHGFWTSAFGGSPDVLGRTIGVSGKTFAIAGVMPEGFSGHAPVAVDAWLPIEQVLAGSPDWDNPFRNVVSVIVRVRPAARAAAGAQAAAAVERRVALMPLDGSAATPDERRIAWWLTAVSAVVLLMGLANGGTLLLVRAARRRRESTIRSALGATRARLAAQLALESIVIGAAASAASLLLGVWLEEMVRRVLLPAVVPADGLEPRMVAAAALAGVLSALVAFLAGLAHLPRAGTSMAGAHGVPSMTRSQRVLLVVQTAVSVLLLAGAGMFGRSFHALLNQDFGMDVGSVLVVDFEQGSGSVARQDEIFSGALETIRGLPGVLSATVYTSMPFGNFHVPPIAVPGRAEPPSVGEQLPFLIAATPELFDVLGIRLTQGRRFTPADERGAPVVIVNETMARGIWPGETAIGKCIRIGFDPDFDPFTATGPPMPSAAVPCREVIGVARDVRQRSVVPTGAEARLMQYYVPLSQVPLPPMAVGSGPHINGLLVRAAGRPDALTTSIRRAVTGGRTDLPFARVTPFADRFERQLRPWNLGTTLLVMFGALATAIAAVGLYAAFAHAVSSRRRELAVRLALGATTRRVRWLILRDASALTGAGALAGAIASVPAGRSIQGLIFGLAPGDPLVLGAACALMLLIALAASLVPALAAARSDPARLLRAE